MVKPKISVIIPARDEEACLGSRLGTLLLRIKSEWKETPQSPYREDF